MDVINKPIARLRIGKYAPLQEFFASGAKLFTLLVHLAIAATALGLSLYAHPQIDDFWRARLVQELGFTGALRNEYTTWSGRWLGTGLSYAASAIADPRTYYSFALLLITAILGVALYRLLRAVLGRELPRRLAAVFTAALLVLYWVEMPFPGETFYWFSGGLEYHLGLAAQIAVIGWLISLPPRSDIGFSRIARAAGLAGLALVVPGFHEMLGLFLFLVLFAGMMVALRVKHVHQLEWGIATAGAALGFAIVYFAPGNEVRLSVAPETQSLARTISLTVQQGVLFGSDWVEAPTLLAATLLFVLHPKIRALRPAWLSWTGVPWKWLIPTMWIVLVVGGFAGPSWGTGRPIPMRTLDAVFLIFLLGWFLTVFVWTRWDDWPLADRPLRRIASAALVVYTLALLLAWNTRSGVLDVLRAAPAYDQAMERRYVTLEAAAASGAADLHLPALPPEPRLFFRADVINDPTHYRNEHLRRYFGLERLTIEQEQW